MLGLECVYNITKYSWWYSAERSIDLIIGYVCLHFTFISVCLEESQYIFLLHKFRLSCAHPSSGDLIERKLEVHENMTLGEVTERAYKVSDMDILL